VTSAGLKRPSAVSALLLLVLLVLAASLLWRSRSWPLVHDGPIMHYIAWRIAEGAAPYRDVFDMNFPGVYLAHLAVLKTLGPGDGAWRVFDLAWLAVAALAVAAFAAPWGRVAAAGGALFFVTYHLAGGAWQAGQRDFVLCPFLLIGALGVARWAEAGCPRRSSSLAWGGLALGAGITIKPHALALAAGLAVVVVVAARRGAVSVWAPAATFGVALAIVPLAVIAWLSLVGALAAWREIVVEYLVPLYARLGRHGPWLVHRSEVWLPISAAVLISLGHALSRRRFTVRHAVAALGVLYGLAHFLAQGKGWEYHLYPLAAFVAVVLFAELEPARAARRPLVFTALAASLVMVLVGLGVKGSEAASPAWISDKERRVGAVVEDLAMRLGPGDRVQMLDTTDGGVHALLRLRAVQPTRFLYDFHFYHDVDTAFVQALRAEFIGDLDRHPPRFIVLFERGWPQGGYERLERFPSLRLRLRVSYRSEQAGDGYVIYAKRDDP